MPIVTPKPAAPAPKPDVVEIAKPEYKGVVVDTEYTPSQNIITHVEGSKWTVSYYSQVLNDDNAPNGSQLTGEVIYRPHVLIRDLVIRVSSDLNSMVFDPASGESTVRGTATIFPSVKPNVGDRFLADIGDGREGIFLVVTAAPRSIFADTAYQIEYVLENYSTQERRGALNRSVVKVYFFVNDFLDYGQNPLVVEEDFRFIKTMNVKYHQVVEDYFRMFSSTEYKVLLVPGQPWPTYDHFLSKACSRVFDTRDAPELQYNRVLNVDDDENLRCQSVWDALLDCDRVALHYAFKRVGTVSTRSFARRPIFGGIYHSGINSIVYPKDPKLGVDYMQRDRTKPIDGSIVQPDARFDPPVGTIPDPADTVPDIHPVLVDDYYILSEAFYSKSDGQSKLELLLQDYLDKKELSLKTIHALAEKIPTWGVLERFYYVPLLLMMMKSAVRSI